MSSEVIHRALDGVRFRYHGDVDLSHPATSVANVVVDAVLREFTSGPPWAGDTVAQRAGTQLDEEFACQDGTLRVGEAVTKDATGHITARRIISVWQGERYNLLTHLYSASTAEAVALINAFQIVEQPDGVVITPRPEGRAAFQERPLCSKFIPEMGIVTAQPRGRREIQGLPSWPGAKVRAGEMFRDTLADGSPYFVLATATAVVTVVPFPEVSPADAADRVSSLDVQVLN